MALRDSHSNVQSCSQALLLTSLSLSTRVSRQNKECTKGPGFSADKVLLFLKETSSEAAMYFYS